MNKVVVIITNTRDEVIDEFILVDNERGDKTIADEVRGLLSDKFDTEEVLE